MGNALRFYQDAGMTVLLSVCEATQADDGSAAAVDRVVYLGSPVAGKRFQAASAPGVAQIAVSVLDSATGLQVPASTVRLALSPGGLGSATPGAAIDVGLAIFSGAGNALPLYMRFDAAAIAAGVYDNLSVDTSPTVEVDA